MRRFCTFGPRRSPSCIGVADKVKKFWAPGARSPRTLVCHAKVQAGTVEPFTQTGFACLLAGMPATTSHIVWTPSGQGTLTCSGKFS